VRYQAILDTARDAIISIDRRGLITDFNQAAEAMFGYASEEVIGRDVSMLMPPPYRDEHAGYIRAYQRTGEKKAIGLIRQVAAMRKNGEVFPMELSVSEARVGDELLYTAIIRDVSALRRAQAWAEARHDVTRVLAISDTLAEAAGPLLDILRRLGGWEAGDLWGLHPPAARDDPGGAGDTLRYEASAVDPALDRGELEAENRELRFRRDEGLLGRAWDTGQPQSLVDAGADPAFAGRKAIARLALRGGVAFPLRDEHRTVAVMAFYSRDQARLDDDLERLIVSLCRQIGEFIAHKRAEEELRKLETAAQERARLSDIGAITAKLVHDLGNPLSGISMQAELLQRRLAREGAPAEALAQPVERLLVGVSRLRELVRGFTDFAREQRLEISPIDLGAFLVDLADHWRPVAAAKNVDVTAPVVEGTPTLRADEMKLRRVFDNLVKNAIEAIEGGRGSIAINASVVVDSRVRIAIADNGSGIPAGVDVFKLFETTKPGGTGIGLPVSKEIVVAHGGDIQFAANVPRGTVFVVELPLGGPSAR
jgi:two-component system, LuxR family, sensor kinase FixL